MQCGDGATHFFAHRCCFAEIGVCAGVIKATTLSISKGSAGVGGLTTGDYVGWHEGTYSIAATCPPTPSWRGESRDLQKTLFHATIQLREVRLLGVRCILCTCRFDMPRHLHSKKRRTFFSCPTDRFSQNHKKNAEMQCHAFTPTSPIRGEGNTTPKFKGTVVTIVISQVAMELSRGAPLR